MIELNTFCALVDSSNERVSPISSDLDALYGYVGLPLNSVMSDTRVMAAIRLVAAVV